MAFGGLLQALFEAVPEVVTAELDVDPLVRVGRHLRVGRLGVRSGFVRNLLIRGAVVPGPRIGGPILSGTDIHR